MHPAICPKAVLTVHSEPPPEVTSMQVTKGVSKLRFVRYVKGPVGSAKSKTKKGWGSVKMKCMLKMWWLACSELLHTSWSSSSHADKLAIGHICKGTLECCQQRYKNWKGGSSGRENVPGREHDSKRYRARQRGRGQGARSVCCPRFNRGGLR